MEVGYKEATEIFERYFAGESAPHLHPYYVQADAKRDSSLEPVYFVYQKYGDIYYHGLHRSAIAGTGFYDLQSPYGYGGPVATTDDPAFLETVWQEYDRWCRQNKILAEFIRFHPLMENWRYHFGEVREDRQTVCVDLTADDISRGFRGRVKTEINKAVKHDIIVAAGNCGDISAGFQPMYEMHMVRLDAEKFYFFPDSYYRKLAAWDKTLLVNCLFEGSVVAAAIFLRSDKIIEYHLSAANDIAKKTGAVHFLLYRAALWGQQHGCRFLHLGGGTNSKPDNNLLFFKAGFSPLRKSYRIGHKIHFAQEYAELKAAWLARGNVDKGRILFYRQ